MKTNQIPVGKFSKVKKKIPLVITVLTMAPAMVIPADAAPTLPNGFTAAYVANTGDVINGTINAAGYDVGIYVGPGVTGVVINGATVTEASDHGILVQDTSGIVIENSTISEGAAPSSGTHAEYNGGPLAEDKAIVLTGTQNCLVKHNAVLNNYAGGIGVYDDGPNASATFALIAIDSSPVPSVGNVVTGNLVDTSGNDCGIVVSSKNPGGGVFHTLVSNNEITGTTGGIIVAGGAFGPVQVIDSIVLNNELSNCLGINVHGFGPTGTTISGTKLIGNELSNNFGGQAIDIEGSPGVITKTQVLHNTLSGEFIVTSGDPGAHVTPKTN